MEAKFKIYSLILLIFHTLDIFPTDHHILIFGKKHFRGWVGGGGGGCLTKARKFYHSVIFVTG